VSDQDSLYVEPDDDGLYHWEDETGLQHYGSEDEFDAWAEENGYEEILPVRPTPDTLVNEYGTTLREMWDVAPDRRAAREAWAVERYRQLKEQG
jgi:hypothetical protein